MEEQGEQKRCREVPCVSRAQLFHEGGVEDCGTTWLGLSGRAVELSCKPCSVEKRIAERSLGTKMNYVFGGKAAGWRLTTKATSAVLVGFRLQWLCLRSAGLDVYT